MKHIKSFGIYAFTTFINAAISFITIALLTHHLNEVDYGIINLYNSFIIFLTPFISVGVHIVLSVDYFKMDQQRFGEYFKNAISIPLASFLMFTFFILVFSSFVQNILGVNWMFVLLLPITVLMTVFSEILLNLMRNRNAHILFAVTSIAKNILEIGLTIFLVLLIGMHWQGRLWGSVFSLGLLTLVAVYLIHRWSLYSGRLDYSLTKSIFFSALPFVFERLAIFVLVYADRFFIDYYKGTADVGFYSAGAQVAIIANLMLLVLTNVFHPMLFRKLSDEKIDYAGVRKICAAYLGICVGVSLILILLTPIIFQYFIGERFQQGQIYAVNLIIGYFFWGLYYLFLGFLLSYKKNRLIMTISLFAMFISIILNFINVQQFGAIGATYTNIAVYFFMAFIVIYFVNKKHPIKNLLFSRVN
jgi:O-antigen/teichoic acid export membrane protein